MSSDFYTSSILPYAPIIIKICRAYTNTQEDFENYYQQVCLQIWRTKDKFSQHSDWANWIYKISLNVCLTLLRTRKSNLQYVVSNNLPVKVSEENSPFTDESLNQLYDVIKQLSEVDRGVMLLYLEDKSNQEIADIMGINTSKIGARIKSIRQGHTRQLASIMFTDIVGYTAIMGKDEAMAMALVRKSKKVQQPIVEKHNGTWLKEMGDGTMLRFPSALDAVLCAKEIQRWAQTDLDCELRIGIHLGDVVEENEDVYGDGVNIAARIQSIADPGGIYVSDSVAKAVRSHADIQWQYLGETQLKNVDYPVKTYALQGVGLPSPELKEKRQSEGKIWPEIRRRAVIPTGVAYIFIALLLIFLAREAESWVTLPDWTLPVVVTILIVGFPYALFFAWNYNLGLKGLVQIKSLIVCNNLLNSTTK